MKKKIIALLVGSAVAAPMAANADVAAYGIAQVEIANVDDGDEATMSLVDNAMGRVGVKASEEMDNGMTALAKFEFKADTVDNDAGASCKATGEDATAKCSVSGVSLSARESMVGLKGGFGTVSLGRLKQPYKYTGGVKYDPFVATTLEARGTAAMSGKVGLGNAFGHSGFASSMLGYENKFGPVGVNVVYNPSTDRGEYMYAVTYGADSYEAFVAGGAGGTADEDFSSMKFGGQFKMNAHQISFQYEMMDLDADTSMTNMFLGYQMKMGAGVIAAAYGMGTVSAGDVDVDGTYMNVGYIHKFSKQTRVFAGYTGTSADDVDGSVISVGMRKDF